MCRHTLFFPVEGSKKNTTATGGWIGLKHVSLGSLLWLSKDSSRPPPFFSSSSLSFPATFFCNLQDKCHMQKSKPRKKNLTHMARRMPINCHKMGKRILRMQTAVGVGDLQGSFFPISIRRGLVSRHQKAEHWPRCWNELTSKVTINQTVVPPPSATPSPKIPSVILKMRGLGEGHYLIDSGFRLQHSLAACKGRRLICCFLDYQTTQFSYNKN